MNLLQDDPSAAFVTTPAQRVRELRHESVHRALALLEDGRPDDARRVMGDCLLTQARVSGIRLD
jgi:hypothetical protein